MCPGMNDLDTTSDFRKTAVIDKELKMLDVDFAALQETRLADAGSIREGSYSFYWFGLPAKDRRIHGVGFAVRNQLNSSVSTPAAVYERLATMWVQLGSTTLHLISAYAPTLMGSNDEKDRFYDELHTESRALFASLTNERLAEKCLTPAGSSITVWKWLRAHFEHEAHHRGQLYLMLGMRGVSVPQLYGLSAEEVQARSVPD